MSSSHTPYAVTPIALPPLRLKALPPLGALLSGLLRVYFAKALANAFFALTF